MDKINNPFDYILLLSSKEKVWVKPPYYEFTEELEAELVKLGAVLDSDGDAITSESSEYGQLTVKVGVTRERFLDDHPDDARILETICIRNVKSFLRSKGYGHNT